MLMTHTSSAPLATSDPRWTAVAARDRRADGAFVYAVRSTGIYCRPSCPSRRPRPDRVEYFLIRPPRQQQGFGRAAAAIRTASNPGPVARRVTAALAVLERAEADSTPSLTVLARQVGCSAAYLQRAFVRVLGVSPRDYAAARKLARFKSGLREGRTIADATFDAGFGSSSRVYEQAARALGMTPAQVPAGRRRAGAAVHDRTVPPGSRARRRHRARRERGVTRRLGRGAGCRAAGGVSRRRPPRRRRDAS